MTKGLELSGNALKVIAIIAMTIDHLAWVGIETYEQAETPLQIFLHIIGRLTAPMMIFFVAEGYYHTHDFRRYLRRLMILAVVSHFAFCYFNIAKLYGRPYKVDNGASLGAVLITEPVSPSEARIPRSSVADTYKQIEEDIATALPLLSRRFYRRIGRRFDPSNQGRLESFWFFVIPFGSVLTISRNDGPFQIVSHFDAKNNRTVEILSR